jgi:hypothetical protein
LLKSPWNSFLNRHHPSISMFSVPEQWSPRRRLKFKLKMNQRSPSAAFLPLALAVTKLLRVRSPTSAINSCSKQPLRPSPLDSPQWHRQRSPFTLWWLPSIVLHAVKLPYQGTIAIRLLRAATGLPCLHQANKQPGHWQETQPVMEKEMELNFKVKISEGKILR